MKSRFWFILRVWLPIAVALLCVVGIVYSALQQDIRGQVNTPLLNNAQQAAQELSSSATLPDESQVEKTDITRDETPFFIIYDTSGKAVFATGELDGQTPALPSDVFARVKATGQEQFTWQPRAGIRFTAVVLRYGGTNPGFILAAESLSSVEARESGILGSLAQAGGASVVISLIAVALVSFLPGSVVAVTPRREAEMAEEEETAEQQAEDQA